MSDQLISCCNTTSYSGGHPHSTSKTPQGRLWMDQPAVCTSQGILCLFTVEQSLVASTPDNANIDIETLSHAKHQQTLPLQACHLEFQRAHNTPQSSSPLQVWYKAHDRNMQRVQPAFCTPTPSSHPDQAPTQHWLTTAFCPTTKTLPQNVINLLYKVNLEARATQRVPQLAYQAHPLKVAQCFQGYNTQQSMALSKSISTL
jgi:hypothetical protein